MQSVVLRAIPDVLSHARELGEDAEALARRRGGGRRRRRRGEDAATLWLGRGRDDRVPGARREVPREHLKRARFPRAVHAEEAEALALAHGERDAVHRAHVPAAALWVPLLEPSRRERMRPRRVRRERDASLRP